MWPDDDFAVAANRMFSVVSVRIELLYFDGCPSYEALLLKLQDALEREGIVEEIELRQVATLDAAEAEHFLGSPTLRIDGEDIDRSAAARSDYGMKCRIYRSAEGVGGVPPEQWITDALQRHSQEA